MFRDPQDEQSAIRSAVERAAEALDAEVAAFVHGGRSLASTGFAAGRVPTRELAAIADRTASTLEVPGVGTCAALAMSLGDRDEGSLIIARVPGEPFDHEDSSMLRGMARVLMLTLRQLRLIESERSLRELSEREVSERRDAEKELAHQALHDALTGLPNRKLLLDRLERTLGACEEVGMVAALFVDVDNFKLINDTLGHHVGDDLLVLLAERLRHSLRSADAVARVASGTVARFGGDEFVLIGEGLRREDDAVGIARRIAAGIADPFTVAGEQLFVTASIGIALANECSTPQSLIRDADTAMYHAKQRGRGRFELFDDAMRGRLVHQLGRQQDLRRALDHGELLLFYQPIIAVADGSIVGAEALVRWRHPEEGLIAAGDFIPLAEDSGLIGRIGEWVLRDACRQLAVWQDSGALPADFTLSVNVSARQLEDGQLVRLLADTLRESGTDPRLLALEITESVLIESSDAPIAVLEALRCLGPQMILDDFGTGYSSLSYLQRLPLDVLKLDRSFVAALPSPGRDQDIIQALIHLARVIGLSVVVEGVETAAQLECLGALGCEYAQGYHISRPMSVGRFTEMLVARRQPGRLAAIPLAALPR